MAKKIDIGGELHSVATGNIVADAKEIKYRPTGKEEKTQAQVNDELIAAVGGGGSVDSKIAAAVNVEKTRAEGAESTLDGKIATEKTRAEAAEQANSTAITNEVSRAQNAEAALGNRITPLEEAVGTIDQRIENATKNAAYIDASDEGSETVNW